VLFAGSGVKTAASTPTLLTMQLALGDGRAVRMLQALLAAADPLDRMAGGESAACYEPLAVLVFDALRGGADLRRIVLLISDHAAGEHGEAAILGPVVAFAHASLDWWAKAEPRWNDPVAI
jgi:hypothetical protein